jgi:hypothetical protein
MKTVSIILILALAGCATSQPRIIDLTTPKASTSKGSKPITNHQLVYDFTR